MYIELTVMNLDWPILLNTAHIVSMQRYALDPEVTEIRTINRDRLYVSEPIAEIMLILRDIQ